MTDSLLYSINTIAPVFLIVILGRLLKKYNFLRADFFAGSDKFVFNVALPVMLFLDLAETDSVTTFNFRLIAYCCSAVLVIFALLCILVPLFVKDNARRGALIQGIYRSNFAILGFSLIENMFGDAGIRVIATVLPFAVILFNMLAVIVLSVFAPQEEKLPFRTLLRTILLNIVKNPLIIALVLALPVLIFQFKLPAFVDGALNYISNATIVLALMSLGANIEPKTLRADFLPSLLAALCKTVIVPLCGVGAAVLLGFRGVELGVILILFGSPTAVSSYIMAKSMGSDHRLAAQILLTSTLLGVLTLFTGIFILKSLALI